MGRSNPPFPSPLLSSEPCIIPIYLTNMPKYPCCKPQSRTSRISSAQKTLLAPAAATPTQSVERKRQQQRRRLEEIFLPQAAGLPLPMLHTVGLRTFIPTSHLCQPSSTCSLVCNNWRRKRLSCHGHCPCLACSVSPACRASTLLLSRPARLARE